MKHSLCRTSGVIVLVIIQLIIIPATQLLHVGCEHSAVVAPKVRSSAYHAVETVWNWCSSSHCCHHCVEQPGTKDERTAAPQPLQDRPVQPPHDEKTCAVCQAAFAARVTTAAPVPRLTNERIAALVIQGPNFEKPTPRYRVLSRGPPPSLCGSTFSPDRVRRSVSL